MARPRAIDRATILDAAEQVVLRDGAARLTLDAVAVVAGISKASVIYDYKTKQALIQAVVERWIAGWGERLDKATEPYIDGDDARLRGRIDVARDYKEEEDGAVVFQLCSAMTQDEQLRQTMNEGFRQELGKMLSSTKNPDKALLALLAIEGMSILQMFGVVEWQPEQREKILSGIEQLITQD
ncbi:TetR/AcrR family transcriptional regulator [Paenochrobactrum glaciei]|uniref:TetR/AcrR family transcriptional regulator n=2 Tax=Paenochrobactrum glaciei TaxID=486407 RepID=A0ABN1FFI0_9HYPH